MEPMWRITVEVPVRVDQDLRALLADAVADAAYDWQPEHRENWDVDVEAGPVTDG